MIWELCEELDDVDDRSEFEFNEEPKFNLESKSFKLSEVSLYSLVLQAIEPNEPSWRFADCRRPPPHGSLLNFARSFSNLLERSNSSLLDACFET